MCKTLWHRENDKPEIDWLQCHFLEGIQDDQVTKMQTSTDQKQQSTELKKKKKAEVTLNNKQSLWSLPKTVPK